MKLKSRVRDVHTINALLAGAEAEARRKGESMPGAEHLLLAALALRRAPRDVPSARRRRRRRRAGRDHRPAAEALRAIGIDGA